MRRWRKKKCYFLFAAIRFGVTPLLELIKISTAHSLQMAQKTEEWGVPAAPGKASPEGLNGAVIHHQQRSASVWGTPSMTNARESSREEKATAAAAFRRKTFYTAWRVCRMMEDRPCLRPLQPPHLFKGRKIISVCHYSPPPQSLSPCPFFPLDPAQQSLNLCHHPLPFSVPASGVPAPGSVWPLVKASTSFSSWFEVNGFDIYTPSWMCHLTHPWIPPLLSQIPSP